MHKKQVVTPFESADHLHSECLKSAISKAEDSCASTGVRLTPLRRRVLELVWKSHEPVKAYDVLETLQSEKKGAAPPTVYRALEFLQQQGFVHKLESLNAYLGCGAPGHNNTSQFLICHKCGVVAELDDNEIGEVIRGKTEKLGFTPKQLTIEINGLCNQCRSN